MASRFGKRTVASGGIVLLTPLMFRGTPALTEEAAQERLFIKSVHVDFDADTITISDENFDNGITPLVVLGDIQLDVEGYDGEKVVASLPDSVLQGDYRLVVITGYGLPNVATYCLTLGAVGPEGLPPSRARRKPGTARTG